MKIVRCDWFPPKPYSGIMLVWWLIVKKNVTLSQRFVNHEEIHSRQQKEMLVLPFFLWYGIEFLVRLVQYRDWIMAYRNISFEREAYANERRIDYLSQRKAWAFVKYIKK